MNIDTIIGYLLDRAKVDVALVRITEPTNDSYAIAIETNVTGTGPISTRVSPMELDLAYNGKCFAKLKMPELFTHWWGAKVIVDEQRVQILDLDTYKDYVRSVIISDETGFQLENGVCTITALGIGIPCTYRLRVPIRGMRGLGATLAKVERPPQKDKGLVVVTARLHNPSPVEMDHGLSSFEFRNSRGEVLSLLSGHVKIVRGSFEVTLEGKLEEGITPTDTGRFVGMGVEGGSWCNETIKHINLEVDIPAEFKALLSR